MKKAHLLIVLILGFAVRMFFIFSDKNRLIESLFFDDSYYLLNIARNIAVGNGITHDGLHMTNGFQPLYVLLLIPFHWIAGLSLVPPIYMSAVFLSLCNILSAYLVYKILEHLINEVAAGFSLYLTLFSPISLQYSLNGMETSLSTMLFLAVAYVYIKDFQFVSLSEHSNKKLVLFGILLGLAGLARVDMYVLIAVVCLEMIYFQFRHAGASWNSLKKALLLTLIILAVNCPWSIFNLAYFDNVIPMSGKAKKVLALRDKPAIDARFSYPLLRGLPYSDEIPFYYHITVKSHRVLKKLSLFPDYIDYYWQGLRGSRAHRILTGGPRGQHFQLPQKIPVLLCILAALPILWALWSRMENRSDRSRQFLRSMRRTAFLILFCGLFVSAYILKVSFAAHFPRYFAPIFYVLVIFMSIFVSIVFSLIRERNKWMAYPLMAAVVCSFLIFSLRTGEGVVYHSRMFRGVYANVIPYIQDNFSATDTFGAFQSGYFSYFLKMPVHNLDGVVNTKVIPYVEQNRVSDYIIEENIDYLVDWPEMIKKFTADMDESALVLVSYFPHSRIAIYKVIHP